MATTLGKFYGVPCGVEVKTFNVTADNDVLLPTGKNYLVLGAFFSGLATAVNQNAGADIATFPSATAGANDTVCATATGAGTVTLVYVEIPPLS